MSSSPPSSSSPSTDARALSAAPNAGILEHASRISFASLPPSNPFTYLPAGLRHSTPTLTTSTHVASLAKKSGPHDLSALTPGNALASMVAISSSKSSAITRERSSARSSGFSSPSERRSSATASMASP